MKKRIFETLAIGGAVLTVASIAWEVARMEPAYRFLVDPWAIRGFDTTHGTVTAVIGVLLLASALLVIAAKDRTDRNRLAALFMAVAAVIVAAVFGKEPATVPLNGVGAIVISIVVAVVIFALVPGELLAKVRIPAARPIIFSAVAIALFIVLAIVAGDDIELPLWEVLAGVMALAVTWSIMNEPRELAAARMLVITSVVAWMSVAVTAGALRTTLVRLQTVRSEYKDTQVTWGYFLAIIGIGLVFVGAVAMWAKRRDIAQAAQRARKQREAALKSAAEIEAALESTYL